jgi:hypothetical protein
MENKTVKVSGDPIRAYITLWNGTWRLTDKEVDVLSEFLRSYLKLKKDGLKEPYLSKYLFSLKKKNIILETENGSTIDERVIPVKKLTFEFNDY